jgi:hypothetical protein
VPEFRARARPEKRVTPCAARNKKCFAGGVFSLFNCCTNVVIQPKTQDGGRRADWELGTDHWEPLFNRRDAEDLPVLQCRNCSEYLIEDAVMEKIDALLSRVPSVLVHALLLGLENAARPAKLLTLHGRYDIDDLGHVDTW